MSSAAALARRWSRAVAPAALLPLLWGGCAAPPALRLPPPAPAPAPAVVVTDAFQEAVAPDGAWRPHLLSRCHGADLASPAAEGALAQAYELYSYQAGSDAIMELEMCLRKHPREGLVLLTLGQLYLLAGQGEPELLPREGPAADVGNWPRNKARLLARAETLLGEARQARPDDGVVDYLLADVHRARGDTIAAGTAFAAGLGKCALTRSFEVLRRYQKLGGHGAELLHNVAPDYPPDAARERVGGQVVLDLLVSPAGRAVQVVTISSPDARLTAAAAGALRAATFRPARVGKYPLWSWLRVPTQFTLAQ